MKIIITENKVFDTIYKYIDSTFPDEIHWTYGSNFDDEGDYVEDEHFLVFYEGDWDDEDSDNVIFYYFDIDYYNEPSEKSFRDKSPILDVIGNYGEHLDEIFQGYWYEPMKKWFQDKFNLPVKTVSAY